MSRIRAELRGLGIEVSRAAIQRTIAPSSVPTLDGIRLPDLDAQHVAAMLEEVRGRHARGGASASEGTAARVYATLRAALNCAVRDAVTSH
jgi:hypothetical protein